MFNVTRYLAKSSHSRNKLLFLLNYWVFCSKIVIFFFKAVKMLQSNPSKCLEFFYFFFFTSVKPVGSWSFDLVMEFWLLSLKTESCHLLPKTKPAMKNAETLTNCINNFNIVHLWICNAVLGFTFHISEEETFL